MRKFYYSSSVLLALSGLLFVSKASAFQFVMYAQTVSANVLVTTPRDLPMGTKLGEAVGTEQTFRTVSISTGYMSESAYGVKVKTSPVSNVDGKNIYAIPGAPGIGYAIGVAFSYSNCNPGAVYWVGTGNSDRMMANGDTNTLVCSMTENDLKKSMAGKGTLHFEFYKTGPAATNAASVSFNAGNVFTWMNAEPAEKSITFSTVTTKALACTVRQKDLTIALDPITFNALKGLGTTAGGKNFSINVDNCDAQLKVGIQLDMGTAGSIDAANGVLNPDISSTSQGVGIQILYGNNPVAFGQVIPRVTSTTPGGSVSADFTARYFQTDAKRVAGTVNASAIYTMSYD